MIVSSIFMKYMGSKRYMLNNGLGTLIRDQLPRANRVIDPFCGAGSVIQFAAKNSDKEIIAGDLQEYAVVLARAVIERTKPVDVPVLQTSWLLKAEEQLSRSKLFLQARKNDISYSQDVEEWVKRSRQLCETPSKIGPVWGAYGGHYFSPKQALIIDYLIKCLPQKTTDRNVCLAALITAASRCAAAPGHTAQPFQPTEGASKFIKISWNMDILKSCLNALTEIAPMHAKTKGAAYVGSAEKLTQRMQKGDLVIIDPPYSGVQYSRFYHVLETIARGKCGKVEGVGRYPVLSERPQSSFSNAGQSLKALDNLLKKLSEKEVNVIFTFPKGYCSNGLSGKIITDTAKKYFSISKKSRTHHHVVKGKFSTLGGNNKLKLKNNEVKKSRVTSEELILLLNPKA
jgi:adenine-specific DNA-methyltransferase